MYELGLAAGTNGNLGTTDVRSSWISLANKNLGEVTIGRQYNPIFLTSASLDAGRANNVAFGRVLYGQIATTRTSGGINYTSPNFNGFVVKAIVGQNETDSLNTVSGVTTANPANASVMGGNISYTLGDLNLQYATHKTNLTATAAAGDRTENLFGGTYTFGNIKALAMYGSAKVKDGVGAQSAKREGYQLGLQASLNGAFNTPGGIDLFATYGSADVQAASDSPERTTKGTQLGGMYNLSKRTGVYAAYGKTTGTLTSSLFTSQGNEFAVGVRHSF
jgi:predicted porin